MKIFRTLILGVLTTGAAFSALPAKAGDDRGHDRDYREVREVRDYRDSDHRLSPRRYYYNGQGPIIEAPDYSDDTRVTVAYGGYVRVHHHYDRR
jgi:hypothetical protein